MGTRHQHPAAVRGRQSALTRRTLKAAGRCRPSPPGNGAVREDLREFSQPVGPGGLRRSKRLAGAAERDRTVPGSRDPQHAPVRCSTAPPFPAAVCAAARVTGATVSVSGLASIRACSSSATASGSSSGLAAILAARLSAPVWPSAMASAVVGQTCGSLPPPARRAFSSSASRSPPGADSTNSSSTPPWTGWTWMLRMLVSSRASDCVSFCSEPGWSFSTVRARHRAGAAPSRLRCRSAGACSQVRSIRVADGSATQMTRMVAVSVRTRTLAT